MKLSIITINFNNANGLKKTIESVVTQTYKDFEYIVIDGGSNDGSIEIIKQYEMKLAYWVSERDYGIYNAMNKGILKATGSYCLFLNSGDILLHNGVLQKSFSRIALDYDIISFDLLFDSSIWTRYCNIPDKFHYYDFFSTSLPHPSTLIKRSLFENNLYNESYKIISDKAWFFDLFYKSNPSFLHVNFPLSLFDMTGISNCKGDVTTNEWTSHLLKYYSPKDVEYLTGDYKYGLGARVTLMSKSSYKLLLTLQKILKKLDVLFLYLRSLVSR